MSKTVGAIPVTLLLTVLSSVLSLGAGREVKLNQCDSALLSEVRSEFQRLKNIRRVSPEAVSEQHFRAVSAEYIRQAESCYEVEFGGTAGTNQIIDHGGLWAPSSGRAGLSSVQHSTRRGGPDTTPKHSLFGTKWGAGSPYLPVGDNPDAVGPALPGGVVTYSFMESGVDLSQEGAGSNTSIYDLPDYEPCFTQEIVDAFAAWSAVADIQFRPVSDSGAPFDASWAYGDIRIGAHAIDGESGVIAHAYYPPPNGYSAAGDLHFDTAESWACDPAPGYIDIGIVALHEIGHSLGLGHENYDPAVMEPSYNPAYNNLGPLADDIIGLGQIYGGSPLTGGYFFGDVGIGTDLPEASLHVTRSDGTSKLLVEETNTSSGMRKLFELKNKGIPFFSINNTSAAEWLFMSDGSGSFSISKVGTGVTEFSADTASLVISGNLVENSDRETKETIEPVDTEAILEQVAGLPIATWTRIGDPSATRHVGPMAQDFYDLFGVGVDERHISTIDTSGVALAAIQGLYEKLSEELARKKAQLDAQNQQIRALQDELQRIKDRLK